jgi:hypothetical protein
MAALGRVMVKAYAAQMGRVVSPVDGDGWCLLTCVSRAMPERPSAMDILACALTVIQDESSEAPLREAVPATIKEKARRLLDGLDRRSRHMGDLGMDDLWDFMPQALSLTCGRPLRRPCAQWPRRGQGGQGASTRGSGGRAPHPCG